MSRLIDKVNFEGTGCFILVIFGSASLAILFLGLTSLLEQYMQYISKCG